MTVSLDKSQIDAVNELRNGCILCGGVGSGKSRTAIAYYFLKECNGKVKIDGLGDYKEPTIIKDLYIITTAHKRDSLEWEGELSPFLLSTHNDISVRGIKVVIDSWNNIGKYVSVSDSFFIFDEQRVIGSGAWVKAFIKITKDNRWILLSATPGDTWSDYIPVFIANGFYKNRTEFLRRHAVYSRYSKYPKVDRWIETRRLEKLKDSILVNINYTRPTTSFNKDIMVSYNRDDYKRIMKTRWDIYEDKPIENISQLCYLLRRISNTDDSRIEAAKQLISQHPKIIVFYNFNYELEILKKIGEDLTIPTREWNGHLHEAIPEKESKWLYLVQYAAGAEGWNCTSTNVILFYSLNYSYKSMIQAAGRIDRRNTPYQELYYYYLRSTSPIDLAINRCLKQKKNFNESNFIK